MNVLSERLVSDLHRFMESDPTEYQLSLFIRGWLLHNGAELVKKQ